MSDSKCKSNVVSQSVALNTTVEQVQRWGEDISNDGLDAISTSKIYRRFFVRLSDPAKFRNVCFYWNSLTCPSF